MEIRGKGCVLAGAASGIGAALARSSANKEPPVSWWQTPGCKAFKRTAQTTGSRAVPVRCDVTVEQDIRAAVQAAEQRAGGLSGDTDGLMTLKQVAHALEATMRSETFLCPPHPEVADYRRKGEDYDRWLGGMQKIYARQVATGEKEE